MKKPSTAGKKPSWIRLMQYSILVLPGPEKAWQTLNSSWYCRRPELSQLDSSMRGEMDARHTHHLLVDPLVAELRDRIRALQS